MTYSKQAWVNGEGGGTPMDATRLNHMEDGIFDASNSGSGNASIFIAASNAPTVLKDRADYVCDGTADDVEINAAIAAFVANVNGQRVGRIVLSSGDFYLSAAITCPTSGPFYYVTLEGSGGGDYWSTIGTVLRAGVLGTGYAINAANNYFSYLTLRDLTVVNEGGVTANKGLAIYNCKIGANDASYYAVKTTSGFLTMKGGIAQANRRACVRIDTGDADYSVTIEDVYLYTSGPLSAADYCIEFVGSGSKTDVVAENASRISGCLSDGNGAGVVHIKNAGGVIVDHNFFYYDAVPEIWVENSVNVIVDSNQLTDGGNFGSTTGPAVLVQESAYVTVANNQVTAWGDDGIRLSDTNRSTVIGNQIVTDVAYVNNQGAGIVLTGSSTDNLVTMNTVYRAGAGNQLKYGLALFPGGGATPGVPTNNIVTMNDVARAGAATANYYDGGTGTVTTAANRTS